jgi:hypothetical protein
MREMSLVEKAKTFKRGRAPDPTSEEVELAVAWAEDKISATQASKALSIGTGGLYIRLALGLRQAIRDGRLIPKEEEDGRVSEIQNEGGRD